MNAHAGRRSDRVHRRNPVGRRSAAETARFRKLLVEHLEERLALSGAELISAADSELLGDAAGGNSSFAVDWAETAFPALRGAPSTLSADGRYVAFVSEAPNLVSDLAFSPGIANVFRLDRHTGEMLLVSVNTAGTGGGNGRSSSPVISSDGSVIAFASRASDLDPWDTDTDMDVFVWNLEQGRSRIQLISVASDDRGSGNGDSHSPVISGDGTVVAFVSQATNLHPLDSQRGEDVYARTLASTPATHLVSVSSSGTASGNGCSDSPSVSGNGGLIAFRSTATNLHPLDTDPWSDIFARSLIGTPTTHLISVDRSYARSGDGDSSQPVVSADGSTVAFRSSAANLHPLDTGWLPDVFARRLTGTPTTHLISMAKDGLTSGDGESGGPVISADGNVVAFCSRARNLHPLDTDAVPDIFARTLKGTPATDLVSVSMWGGMSGNGKSDSPAISADGRVVAFRSWATNLHPLDADALPDIYARDLKAMPTPQLISVGQDHRGSGNGESAWPAVSSDGTLVAFASGASNLAGRDFNRRTDVFARLISGGITELISTRHEQVPSLSADGSSRVGSDCLSADGRYVVFTSDAPNLVPDVTVSPGVTNVYRGDRSTGEILLVSVSWEGLEGGNGDSFAPVISADGRTVAFVSRATNLHPRDPDPGQDIYARTFGGTPATHLISIAEDGTSGGHGWSYSPVISDDGAVVAFASYAGDLHPLDTNFECDVFARRLGETPSTALISSSHDQTGSGNRGSYVPVISGDGRYVAFVSEASNLVPACDLAAKIMNIYRSDLHSGATVLVSTNREGTGGGNGRSDSPTISQDGSVVAFRSDASNLHPLDEDSGSDVFARVWAEDPMTVLVSVDQHGGGSGNCRSDAPVVSADGTVVAFRSDASNLHALDPDQGSDVFAYRLGTARTQLVSLNATGTHSGNGCSYAPDINSEGSLVIFQSDASDLHPLDNDTATDIFAITLSGTLTRQLVSVGQQGACAGQRCCHGPFISADGQTIAFSSSAGHLVDRDYNGTEDIFSYVLSTPQEPTVIRVDTPLDEVNPQDGVISLREAVLQANATAGDFVIELNAGTYSLTLVGQCEDGTAKGEYEDAASTGDLDILANGRLTIRGADPDRTIIQAVGRNHESPACDRLFQIHPGAELELQNLTVTGGSTPLAGTTRQRSGGGILVEAGRLDLTNVVVRGNQAHQNGGGIANIQGQLTVIGSRFQGNAAPAGDGGAIWNLGGQTTIASSTLEDNSAFNGGGIANVQGALAVTASTLSQGHAAGRGGAVYSLAYGSQNGVAWESPPAQATITHSQIAGNRAGLDGGGIYSEFAYGDSITEESAEVRLVSQLLNGSAASWLGPADAGDDSGCYRPLTVAHSTLTSNLAGESGGGICSTGAGNRATLDSSRLAQNEARLGGGIHNLNGQLAVLDSALDHNSAEFGGGIANFGQLTVSHSTLSGNRAQSPRNDAGSGGAIYGFGAHSDISLSDSQLWDNAARRGGGIYNADGRLRLVAAYLAGNAADEDGGGICNRGSTSSVNLAGQSCLSGNAAGRGGGIFLLAGQLVVLDSSLDDNSAEFGGGIANFGQLTVSRSTLSDNRAQSPRDGAGSGGAIYGFGAHSDISLSDSLLQNNTAQLGGGIANDGGRLAVSACTVTGNSADGDGGGLNNLGQLGHLAVVNSTIAGNRSARSGGGLSNAGKMSLANSTVVANRAALEGGGIRHYSTAVNARLQHAIVAGNIRGQASSSSDIHGEVQGTYNLIGDGSATVGLRSEAHNIIGVDWTTVLAPELKDNGGPTPSHALLPASPAIDAGDPEFDPSAFAPPLLTDQRGFVRIAGPAIDIGACEYGDLLAGAIYGIAFRDLNADGLYAAEVEPPRAGAQFMLTGTDLHGNPVARPAEMSDVHGQFAFTGLLPGSYTIQEQAAPGFAGTTPLSCNIQLGSGQHYVWRQGAAGLPDDAVEQEVFASQLRFGNTLRGSFHGLKYLDVDADGSYDSDVDRPLAGARFVLSGTDGQGCFVSLNRTTDEQGRFSFVELLPGSYTIQQQMAPGYHATTPASFSTALTSGQRYVWRRGAAASAEEAGEQEVVASRLTFGNTVLGSFHGLKYLDGDANGSYDPERDRPLAGVEFVLSGIDGQGRTVGPLKTLSDEQGEFAFTGLVPGSYTLAEQVPAGSEPTTSSSLTTELRSGQQFVWWSVAAADDAGVQEVLTELRFGTTLRGSFRGRAYEDVDADGVPDPDSDLPLAGVELVLRGTDGLGRPVAPSPVQANDQGEFAFDDLLPGNYIIAEQVPPGFVTTSPASFSAELKSGQHWVWQENAAGLPEVVCPQLAFGSARAGSFQGLNYHDVHGNGRYDPDVDQPLASTQFVLDGRDLQARPVGPLLGPMTAAGEFKFDHLLPGDYTITGSVPLGFIATTPSSISRTLAAGQQTVWREGAAEIWDASWQTEVVESGLRFGHTHPGSIQGLKYDDVNVDGIYDPAVDLPLTDSEFVLRGTDGQGQEIGPRLTRTNDLGEFAFVDLLPGSYTISENLPSGSAGQSFRAELSSGQQYVWRAGAAPPTGGCQQEVVAGAELTFGNTVPGGFYGFQYKDIDGDGAYHPQVDQPLAGVHFVLSGVDAQGNSLPTRHMHSDVQGEFSFVNLLPGHYTITAQVSPGFAVSTAASFITLLSAGEQYVWRAGAAAGCELCSQWEVVVGERLMFGYRMAGAFHGLKYEDVDADGLYDPEVDRPLAGMPFELSGTDPQGHPFGPQLAHSDQQGQFSFVDLPSGSYTISELNPPASAVATTATSFDAELTAGQLYVWRAGVAAPALLASEQELVAGAELMFGHAFRCAFHGFAYDDLDANGVYQLGRDRTLPGVQVVLHGTDGRGNPVGPVNQYTDERGEFGFTDLLPGSYSMVAEAPAHYVPTTAATFTGQLNSGEQRVWRASLPDCLGCSSPQELVLGAELMFGNTNARPWQNPADPWDVDASGYPSPADALAIINDINAHGARPLRTPGEFPGAPPPYVDVNGDDSVSAADVLLVINFLNQPPASRNSAVPGVLRSGATQTEPQVAALSWPGPLAGESAPGLTPAGLSAREPDEDRFRSEATSPPYSDGAMPSNTGTDDANPPAISGSFRPSADLLAPLDLDQELFAEITLDVAQVWKGWI